MTGGKKSWRASVATSWCFKRRNQELGIPFTCGPFRVWSGFFFITHNKLALKMFYKINQRLPTVSKASELCVMKASFIQSENDTVSCIYF